MSIDHAANCDGFSPIFNTRRVGSRFTKGLIFSGCLVVNFISMTGIASAHVKCAGERAVATFGDQSLQAQSQAARIRADLATLERINEDAFGVASGRERRELIDRPPTRASASVAR